tara:strand:+ start:654 stop:1088 length:435 start_codon:yes stop_codon:yes gene_type:complete
VYFVLSNNPSMKKILYASIVMLLSCSSPVEEGSPSNDVVNELMTESDIADLANTMSQSLAGRKIVNTDIRVLRVYSIGRTVVTYYDVPNEMELDQSDVKSQRVKQLRSAGFAEEFIINKINFEMWFQKNDEIYMKVRINYQDLM